MHGTAQLRRYRYVHFNLEANYGNIGMSKCWKRLHDGSCSVYAYITYQ